MSDYQLFPDMGAAEYEEMKADIQSRGVMVPVEYDEAGNILDGHHRIKACKELGITEWPSVVRLGISERDKRNHIRKLNLARRHLTGEQRDKVLLDMRADGMSVRQIADETKIPKSTVADVISSGVRNRTPENASAIIPATVTGKDGKQYQATRPERKAPEPELPMRPARPISIPVAKPGQVAKVAAQAQAVIEHAAPETVAKLAANDINLVQAQREVKEQAREQRREENRVIVQHTAPLADVSARFATIVIDPPWDWGDEGDVDQMGRARPDYATMPYEKLLALPVADKADTDCHLYLWITNRSLPKGFALLEAWGFRYITCLTWVKPHFGLGNYFRGMSEQVLFGVKGSQPLKRKDAGTVFHAPRGPGGHSSKPVEFYDFVESCSPGPYLEMFSRAAREDWTTWGEPA